VNKADESPDLRAFIHDAKRFALYNRPVIEQTPLQSYCSALVFSGPHPYLLLSEHAATAGLCKRKLHLPLTCQPYSSCICKLRGLGHVFEQKDAGRDSCQLEQYYQDM
jgi:hypothetical protein